MQGLVAVQPGLRRLAGSCSKPGRQAECAHGVVPRRRGSPHASSGPQTMSYPAVPARAGSECRKADRTVHTNETRGPAHTHLLACGGEQPASHRRVHACQLAQLGRLSGDGWRRSPCVGGDGGGRLQGLKQRSLVATELGDTCPARLLREGADSREHGGESDLATTQRGVNATATAVAQLSRRALASDTISSLSAGLRSSGPATRPVEARRRGLRAHSLRPARRSAI